MHGHGEKPFLCTYDGCDRGIPGNGFPRHWNLRDHMRRVHNDPGASKSNGSEDSPPPSGPVRGKKRKAGAKPSSPVMEKSEKFIKHMPSPPQEPKQELSPFERYQTSQQSLLNFVQMLEDPTVSNRNALFGEAAKHFKAMHTHAQAIQTSKNHRIG